MSLNLHGLACRQRVVQVVAPLKVILEFGGLQTVQQSTGFSPGGKTVRITEQKHL